METYLVLIAYRSTRLSVIARFLQDVCAGCEMLHCRIQCYLGLVKKGAVSCCDKEGG